MTSLRSWQRSALDLILSSHDVDSLIVATPGAGKTRFALNASEGWLLGGAGDMVVIVVPTSHLTRQWSAAASEHGLRIYPGVEGLKRRDIHGVAVTYHQVARTPGLFSKLAQQRRIVSVLDEIHHAGDGLNWGMALQRSFEGASKRLALSGTPFRSDLAPIPFIPYVDGVCAPTVSYTYSDALMDHVCRPVWCHTYGGEVSWTVNGSLWTATFDDSLPEGFCRDRLRAAVMDPGWRRGVLQAAHAKLQSLRETHSVAGGLVVTMDQNQARQVAEQLRQMTGTMPTVVISDDPDASDKIKSFRSSGSPWLVAVNMVSEGVDIPRLRVGVYLSNILTELYFRQVVGRLVRWDARLDGSQSAHFYLPRDPQLVRYAKSIEDECRRAVSTDMNIKTVAAGFTGMMQQRRVFESAGGRAEAGAVLTIESDGSRGVVAAADQGTWLEEIEGLRREHQRMVCVVSTRAGVPHRAVQRTLIERTGSRIAEASQKQLERRIGILRKWASGTYDGARAVN